MMLDCEISTSTLFSINKDIFIYCYQAFLLLFIFGKSLINFEKTIAKFTGDSNETVQLLHIF